MGNLFDNRKVRWGAAGIAGAVLLVFLLVSGVDSNNPSRLVLFIGHFHPVIVHFPIGFLLLAALLELAPVIYRPLAPVRQAVPFVLGLGIVGSVFAVVAGFFLSFEGGYQEALVRNHKLLGISVLIGSVLAAVLLFLSRYRLSAVFTRAFHTFLYLTAGLVLWTGHLGGTLTHGSGYLTENLPDSFKRLVGFASFGSNSDRFVDVDSALVFEDLIAPILKNRCVECHGEGKTKGDLRLDSPEGLQNGGESGSIFTAGHPENSEIVRRITLPLYDEDVMPPEGELPLTIGETELIRWWIANGASFEQRVGDVEELPSSVQTIINRLSRPLSEKKTGIFALDVPPADSQAINAAEASGLIIRSLGQGLPFLQVSALNVRSQLDETSFALLRPLSQQIADLDLSNTSLSDTSLNLVSEMPHLTRLHLQGSGVGDDALRYLKDLAYLQYLNLYGTRVTDSGLDHLTGLASLRSLYLWQTEVTENGVRRLLERLPNLEVNLGTTLAEVTSGEPDSTVIRQ